MASFRTLHSITSSTVILLLFHRLIKVRINILRQWAVLEAVGRGIVLRQGVHLHFVALGLEVIEESTVLASALALVPVVDLLEAHARGHFLRLDAVGHPLHEGVAGMRLHVY